ncbi:hypothetical protein EII14_01380 [Alloprevotella sp. OH1205_COT-284]|uniref:hypothetical protein n=1 Tax=Alloprevotella sp. OH1205_COT-284 TaxID=2491043 RepID=UPI000F5FF918|nr:hypothetical protein [Alloprevotella sp. OH1205_COT-284]RRD80676.1 hypothetical protein EII14_01380 [Alloprevotella sp. OH1205_COT-284]
MNKKLFFVLPFLGTSMLWAGCQNEKMKQQEKELEELRQLAEMDRREMENQYEQFALQYDELKKGVKDDSLLIKLTQEQERTKQLLEELRSVKRSDAAEIRRLKKELEAVRAVLRTYIIQVDSLTRENGRLTSERDEARNMLDNANSVINNLDMERAQLSDKVAIASQLNASGIAISPIKKNSKPAKKVKDVVRFGINFVINRNVTAATGERMVYVRLMNPNGTVIGVSGSFGYENKTLESSASKLIEYTGEEQRVSLVVSVANDFLSPGRYTAHVFCDGQMIGTGAVNMDK